MPKEIDWLFEVRRLLYDNSLIIEAWLDDPDHPTALNIRHRKTFTLRHCKISQALTSLKLFFHKANFQREPQLTPTFPRHERNDQ